MGNPPAGRRPARYTTTEVARMLATARALGLEALRCPRDDTPMEMGYLSRRAEPDDFRNELRFRGRSDVLSALVTCPGCRRSVTLASRRPEGRP